MQRKYALTAFILGIITMLACAARKPGDPLSPGFNLFSKEQDVQIGKESAAEVRKQVEIVQNPELQNYITRIGRRLASQPEAGDYPYTFEFVNDKDINAFALPGGPTFFNTGLLLAAQNEAQLAGVVAHEISHVALRHGTNQVSKAQLIQLPAAVAGAALGSGALGQIVNVGLGVGLNGLFLSYSREAENQADALGSRIMAQAGYNPLEMARFFEILEEKGGGGGGPQFLSSHPNPGNRTKAVEAEIRSMHLQSNGNFDFRAGDFQRMKALAQQLQPPTRKIDQQAPAN